MLPRKRFSSGFILGDLALKVSPFYAGVSATRILDTGLRAFIGTVQARETLLHY